MRVLYITNGINGAGGLERILALKINYFITHFGYEVHVVTLNGGHEKPFYEFHKEIQFHDLSVFGNPFHYWQLYKKGIRAVVQRLQPDLVLVCDDGLKGFCVPLLLGKKQPIIYERHVSKAIEFHEDMGFLKRLLVRGKHQLMDYLGTKFDRFVVLTEGNTQEWPLRNLVVIPNCLTFYPNQNATLEAQRLIAVGKHGYQKGFDRLLLSWKMINAQFPDWSLHIYGKYESDRALIRQAETMGLADSVVFHEPTQAIQEAYLKASIFVFPSRFEGFGMVLTEAMACGLPCISYDCPYGPSDIIQHGNDGFLIQNGDIDAFAEAMRTLIQDVALRKAMGLNAKMNAQRYEPEAIMLQWQELFKTVCR
jgi:glycosyltransferase involved in cell wall biosynthesis